MTDWPFEDKKNTAVFTVGRVLEGADIVRVFHDIDGFWQFYDTSPVDEGSAELVTLEALVELDASLTDIADLPRGFVAERDGPGLPWRQASQYPLEWDALVEESEQYVAQLTEDLEDDFALSEYTDVDYSADDALIRFTSPESMELEADAVLIGSISSDPPMWLWGWANTALEDSGEMASVRAFGEKHGIEPLALGQFEAKLEEGDRIAAVAARILEADGMWRVETDNGAMFLGLLDLRATDEGVG